MCRLQTAKKVGGNMELGGMSGNRDSVIVQIDGQ
jgi:hypothetical protein